MLDHALFIKSLHEKRILTIVYDSKDKGVITRKCAPLDYGPSQRKGKVFPGDKYHVYDLNSPDGAHPIAMSPDRIVSMAATNDFFNPSSFITWEVHWIIPRNW